MEELIFEHLGLVEETIHSFQKALFNYLANEDPKEAGELALSVHKLEGQADDVRRKVEAEILGGALLASSRGEMMEIIERVDKLANSAEALLDFLLLQGVKVPGELKPEVEEITLLTLDIFEELKKALHQLFKDRNKALDHTKAIEKKEGQVDELERDFIQQLFSLDISLAEKIMVRDFLLSLTEISDRAEDLSDRLEMAVAQRLI